MKKIVLISCVSKKLNSKAKASELYVSPLFKKSLVYANYLKPDKIFILSAKYGLLNLDDEINPYNETLNKMKTNQIKAWSKNVLESLKKETDLENDEYIFLAGKNYRRYLIPYMKHFKIPLEGLTIGKQLKFLNKYQKL